MTKTTPHQIRCINCDHPMKWRKARTWWEGDNGFDTYEYECQNACQTYATVSYRTFIPIDVARMQPEPGPSA